MHAVTGSQFANIRNIAVYVHMIHVKSNTQYQLTEIKKYIATHFDAAVNVYNIILYFEIGCPSLGLTTREIVGGPLFGLTDFRFLYCIFKIWVVKGLTFGYIAWPMGSSKRHASR